MRTRGTVFTYRYERRQQKAKRKEHRFLLRWFGGILDVRKKGAGDAKSLLQAGAKSANGSGVLGSPRESSLVPPPFIIHPLSTLKRTWDTLITLLVLYNTVIIPWNLAFKLNANCSSTQNDEQDGCHTAWDQFVNIALDAVFWMDIIVAFRTGYVDRKKNVHLEPWDAAMHYLKGWFAVDLIANFPCQAIGAGMVDSGTTRGMLALNLFKIPKLLRMARLMRGSQSIAAPNIFRLFKMMLVFVLISHWCGCLWYFLGRWQAENVGANTFTGDVTWIQVPLGDETEDGGPPTYQTADFQTKYTASVYWALTTMSTVGFGDILPKTNMERFYTMMVQFLGATCTAMILGNVAVLIANFDNSTSRFRQLMDNLDDFIRVHDIPASLGDQVRSNIEHFWNIQQGIDVNTVLSELPENLKANVLMHLQCNVVQESYLFKRCDKAFIKAIVLRLKQQGYLPDTVIVEPHETPSELFFIKHGKVKVLGDDGETLYAVLEEGDMFGELEVFGGSRRTAVVQALTTVDLYVLSIDDFEDVLTEFPEYYAPLKSACARRAEEFADRRRRMDNLDACEEEDDVYISAQPQEFTIPGIPTQDDASMEVESLADDDSSVSREGDRPSSVPKIVPKVSAPTPTTLPPPPPTLPPPPQTLKSHGHRQNSAHAAPARGAFGGPARKSFVPAIPKEERHVNFHTTPETKDGLGKEGGWQSVLDDYSQGSGPRRTSSKNVEDIAAQVEQLEKMQCVLNKTEEMQNDLIARIMALGSQVAPPLR